MDIYFKKLNDLAKIPTKGSKYSAGYDLYAATDTGIHIPPHSTVKINTGLAMDIPVGYFGAIFARSGIATKRGLRPANCTSVIDCDYRGELLVPIHNDTDNEQYIEAEERIAQLIILPYQDLNFIEVDELQKTDRGEGGFGSSGKK